MTHDARWWRGLTPRQWGLLALNLALNLAIYLFSPDSPDGWLLAFNNTLVNPTWIMKEGLFRQTNSLRFTSKGCNRSYDKKFVVDGAKVGSMVSARLPVEYLVRDGSAFQGQDIEERTVNIEITDQVHIAFEFGSWALTFNVDEYRERYLEGAFDRLSAEADKRGFERMAQQTSEFIGTPGVPPGSTGTMPYDATGPYLDVGVVLDDLAVPMDDRNAFLPPKFHRYLVGGQQAIFNPAQAISEHYRKGQFGAEALGIDSWYKTQSSYRHTVGPLGGTPLVVGAGQSGSSINTNGWTAAAANRLKKGDKISFASSFAVNPQTKVSTGVTKKFTVTADVDGTAGGLATIPIKPAIVGPGSPYQNVSALPANGDVILIFGHASTYANTQTVMGIIGNKNAYAAVTADLEQMEGSWVCERIRSKAVGIAFRLWKDSDIRTDSSPCRIDEVFGYSAVREQLSVVIVG